MALTDLEKYKIVTWLGHPAKTLVTDSTHYNNIIAARLDNLDTNIEIIVRDKMDHLESLEEKRLKGLNRAGVKRIDDIELNGEELRTFSKERNRLLNELSDLLDIPKVKSGSGMIGVCV